MIWLVHKEQPENVKHLDTPPGTNDSFVLGKLSPCSEFHFLYHVPMYLYSTSYPSN